MSEYGVKLPDIGEGVAEAEVVEWMVAVGDQVRRDQALAEVMTDKASVEITAPVDGVVLHLGGLPGEFIAVGADLVVLTVDGPVEAAQQPAPSPSQAAPTIHARPAVVSESPAVAGSGKPTASPPVRKRARLAGIDLAVVSASGSRGQVTHADLDGYLNGELPASSVVPIAASASPMAATDTASPSDITEVPLVGLRRRIAAKMSVAKARIPHITYVEEVDVTALEELRAHLNAEAVASTAPNAVPPKLTLLPFIIAAVRKALLAHPEMNATFDDEAEIVSHYAAFHCGVAADTPKGLVVPVIHHAEVLDIWGLASAISRLSSGARSGSLTSAELSGSTFTVSSLGRLGGVVSTPIINHPEVAILGVNKVVERPVVVDSEIVVRRMMNLSGSFDHRVVDGMDVAQFMQKIKRCLEYPVSIFVSLPPG